jgi:AcrR family transcriptional regulator
VPKVSEGYLAERRRQILEASMACFAREGFHRTTMKHIVAQARLSPGAIYRYFRSKEEIIETLARERHAEERTLLRRALAAADPIHALRDLAQDLFGRLRDPAERERRRVGIQVWSEALRHPRILRLVRRGVDEPRQSLARLVAKAQARGDVAKGLDPDAAARALIALFQGFVLQLAWDPRADPAGYQSLLVAALEGRLRTARGR